MSFSIILSSINMPLWRIKTVYARCFKRMLALQLKELEEDNITSKEIFPVMPPKTEYSLTSFGQTLIPLIDEMNKWGQMDNEKINSNQQQLPSPLQSDKDC